MSQHIAPAVPVREDFDALCIEAYRVLTTEAGMNQSEAARRLGIDRGTFRNRIAKYHLRDLGQALPGIVQPGQEVKSHTRQFDKDGNLQSEVVKTGSRSSDEPFALPEGHRVKGVSAFLDGDGTVRGQWVKTTVAGVSPEEIAEAARLAAERWVKPTDPLVLRPDLAGAADPNLLNLHLLPDLHLGLQTTLGAAQIDWNLSTAVAAYKRLMALLIDRAPAAEVGVVLSGGDLLHYDDDTRMTRQSGNRLEGAEPYAVVLSEAELLMVYQVDLALRKYPRVVVRVLKGNHDPDSAIAVAHFLRAWFRNEPRVAVDLDDSDFWFFQHGEVFLAAVHGHAAKVSQMPGIMAADRPKVWGATHFRYAHGFHVHHRTVGGDETGGAQWETHQAPVPRDPYHQQKGYRAGRSLSVVTYHRLRGETGRSMESLAV